MGVRFYSGATGHFTSEDPVIARAAPYTVRVAGGRRGHGDLRELEITLPKPPYTMRRLMSEIVRQMPSGWQATRLPGRVIMYKEHEDDYPGGEVIARS